MELRFIIAARQELDSLINRTESEQNKRLSPAARNLLQAIMDEALTTRENEWRTRAQVLFDSYGSDRQFSGIIRESFGKVLSEMRVDREVSWITTRDILESIQRNWCGVFPVC
jgi:hypothetical protein